MLVSFAGVNLYAQKNKAQTREQLESQRLAIIEEIKRTQSELADLRKDKKASLSQLMALQNKLAARQSLILNINKEINILEENINMANRDVTVLRTQLDTLRKQYAEMVRYTYKNKTSSDMIVFLFSASNFNDAIRRLQYVKQYRGYRADQALKITSASKQLSNKITVLNIEKQKKDFVLQAQEIQNKILEAEKAEKDRVFNELKGREKNLTIGLAQKKKAADDLNRAISSVIKREIEMAQKRAMQEKLAKQRAQKQKDDLARKNAALKKQQDLAAAEKRKKEDEATRLALAKKQQEENERRALADKQKREEQERKLMQDRLDREAKERALAQERKQREENERKAAKMAEAQRIEREKQLAIEKKKQEDREAQLAREKQKQEERQSQLLAQKQRQEEEARRLVEEKKKQEREQKRLASQPFNNPRYIPSLAEKQKYGEVALNTGSSEGNRKEVEEVETKNVKTFEKDDYKFALTPEERQLTSSLEASRGRLPWPVEKGFVIEHFGKNKHPLFNIYTENYGVDIKTSRGASARSIFAGEVTTVISIPGTGQTVIVNHGGFFTVYAKLSNVVVAKGSRVGLKQRLGSVMTDEDGNTQVHFEIWKVGANGSPFKMNPEQWIAQ
ncbi:MAG: peptidoglycan DD-metalloendopeptidase family protein [Chitinophagaceae bacterium]|nr:peptidoglycan DD-metalloendopeptidase family protein [Chitinophagaceae bacterium]